MDASADLLKVNHRLESRVPEIGLLGSEGGATSSVVPTPISVPPPRPQRLVVDGVDIACPRREAGQPNAPKFVESSLRNWLCVDDSDKRLTVRTGLRTRETNMMVQEPAPARQSAPD